MFNKEEFINDFVAAVQADDVEKQQEVLSRLTEDDLLSTRVELIEGIIAKLDADEGDYAEYVKELKAQIELLNTLEAITQEGSENSSSEDTKDEESKVEEATEEVAADTGADVESGGYAPTTEEKAEKTEQ